MAACRAHSEVSAKLYFAKLPKDEKSQKWWNVVRVCQRENIRVRP